MLPYRSLRVPLIVLAVLSSAATTRGQTPDYRGEVHTRVPRYKGTQAQVPVPLKWFVRNEDGSAPGPFDGLCVIAGTLIPGLYQGIPGFNVPGPPNTRGTMEGQAGKGSRYWRTAKSRPGGYNDTKLKAFVAEVVPGERYSSYLGTNAQVLEHVLKSGRPVAVTMNTGQNYNYSHIAHMVTLIHFEVGGMACVIDNNFREYCWMPADEFLRRWVDYGTGWAFWWVRQPSVLPVVGTDSLGLLVLGVGGVSLVGALALVIRQQQQGSASPWLDGLSTSHWASSAFSLPDPVSVRAWQSLLRAIGEPTRSESFASC
jgi:hypothetical protein